MNKPLYILFLYSSLLFSQPYGTWSITDSLLIGSYNSASVELSDGNVLVTGGEISVGINNAEIFDYVKNQWEQTTPMIVGRMNHILIKLGDGRILCIGGFREKSCEIYNSSSKTWSLTGSLNYERVLGYTATLLNNGNVLVTGGLIKEKGINKNSNYCEIFNASDGSWAIIDTLKSPRVYHTATKLSDGRVLVAGGYNKSVIGTDFEESEIFDPQTNKWTDAATLNIGRGEHSATLLSNGKVLVSGGGNYFEHQKEYLNSCELYDPGENNWTIVNPLMVPHSLHSPVLLKNGMLLITGGGINKEVWEIYNPVNFSNVFIDYYPDKQSCPLINLLPNGKVLSAGGTTWSYSSGLLELRSARMCYLYDPDKINGVGEEKNTIIKEFKLYQNFPNPFNPNTTLKYELPKPSHVIIKIYNSLGKEITTLVNKTQLSGSYMTSFNSKGLASGVYFYQIITEKWTQTNKMLVIK